MCVFFPPPNSYLFAPPFGNKEKQNDIKFISSRRVPQNLATAQKRDRSRMMQPRRPDDSCRRKIDTRKPKVSNVTHPRTWAWRDNHITADTYAFASPPAAATAACTAAMQPSPAISTPTHIALLAAEMIAAFEHFWSKSFAFCAVCGMPRLAAFARESGHGLVASKRICYQKICVFGCNGQQMVTHL